MELKLPQPYFHEYSNECSRRIITEMFHYFEKCHADNLQTLIKQYIILNEKILMHDKYFDVFVSFLVLLVTLCDQSNIRLVMSILCKFYVKARWTSNTLRNLMAKRGINYDDYFLKGVRCEFISDDEGFGSHDSMWNRKMLEGITQSMVLRGHFRFLRTALKYGVCMLPAFDNVVDQNDLEWIMR